MAPQELRSEMETDISEYQWRRPGRACKSRGEERGAIGGDEADGTLPWSLRSPAAALRTGDSYVPRPLRGRRRRDRDPGDRASVADRNRGERRVPGPPRCRIATRAPPRAARRRVRASPPRLGGRARRLPGLGRRQVRPTPGGSGKGRRLWAIRA